MSSDTTEAWILRCYRAKVAASHPDLVSVWPVLSGYNLRYARLPGWHVYAFEHTGNTVSTTTMGLGELPHGVLGGISIDNSNREIVRTKIERHLRIKTDDCVFLLQDADNNMVNLADIELTHAMSRHEAAMGISPMKVFLSHKTHDKSMVREFDKTLQLLGYKTWLDEDAMNAGAHLERGLLDGFEQSCAAVFFITTAYKDEGYLSTEIDYAIRQKRAKKDRFQIITIAFDGLGRDAIPELLRDYVWKSPTTQLQALREIIKALPLKLGDPSWSI